MALSLLGAHCSSTDPADDDDGVCGPPDQDGVLGGDYSFEVRVSDTAFEPVILKAQNSGKVTLKVRNTGSKPHGFAVQCLTIQGCTSCFPPAATIAPLPPGGEATIDFVAPEAEGIYTITSGVPGDTFTAQIILQ